MQTVLIVIHLMIVVALVAVVLLQRSEGGALGVGGGSGFMTGRGQANVLTRATAILGTLFFITSLALTLLANYGGGNKSVLEGIVPASGGQPASTGPAAGKGTVLDQLRRIEDQRANSGLPGQAGPAQAPRSTATPSAATPSTTSPTKTSPPTTSPTVPAASSTPANATPVPKAAPVEPTGIPTEPSAHAPSAPVQESPVPSGPATAPGK